MDSRPHRDPQPLEDVPTGVLDEQAGAALQTCTSPLMPGQVYGLLGPNGAGKSTTIKILMNLVRPPAARRSSSVAFPGLREARRSVGFLPENPAPYEYLTGEEFVTLAGQLCGLSGKELDYAREGGAGRGGHDARRGPADPPLLQGHGAAHRPGAGPRRPARLLILDEPTCGLDPVGRREIRDLILEERERGTTVLFCTHIIPDVEALCDRVAVLVGGRRVREGSVQELVTHAGHAYGDDGGGPAAGAHPAMGIELEQARKLENRVLLRARDADSQRAAQEVLERAAGSPSCSRPASRWRNCSCAR